MQINYVNIVYIFLIIHQINKVFRFSSRYMIYKLSLFNRDNITNKNTKHHLNPFSIYGGITDMKSIQTKIISLIFTSIVLSTVLVIIICSFNITHALDKDSNQIIHLLCAEKTNNINETLNNVEQSVNTIYNVSNQIIEKNNNILTNEKVLETYLTELEAVATSSISDTNCAVSVYLRINPDISGPNEGFFLTRLNDDGMFEDTPLTDLSKYPRDDYNHVGWYYVPIDAGCPIWLAPYNNENLEIDMISYVIPIFVDDVTLGVVGMDIDISHIRNLVSEITVYDTGYGFLIDEEGNLIYHPDFPDGINSEDFTGQLKDLKNMFIETQKTEKLYDYEWYGEEKTMTSLVLDNGMSLAIAAPKYEIDEPKRQTILQSTLMIFVVLVISLLLSTKIVKDIIRPLKQLTEAAKKIAKGNMDVSIECNSKDEIGVLAESFRHTAQSLKEYITYINRRAYTDALTGIRNKTAYSEQVALIEGEIKAQKADFALIIMDINNLKYMNDNFGHELGDLLIVNAATIMKETFGELNVFRIGGDEFVVILQMLDRLKHQLLMEDFEKALAKFNKDNTNYDLELQIARGVAIYQKGTDYEFADVFRRADGLMYENKKVQKAKSGTFK